MTNKTAGAVYLYYKKMKTAFILLIFLAGCTKQSANPEPPLPVVNSSGNTDIEIIHDHFEDQPVVVAGSSGLGFIVSFINEIDGKEQVFTPVSGKLPVIMKDSTGSEWDITGKAVSGIQLGKRLTPTHSFMGYWFSWAAFYPGPLIFDGKSPTDSGGPWYLEGDYLIPRDQILDGGPGKDGIPALESPEMIPNEQVGFLNPEDRVLGIIDDTPRAYPVKVLDYHEIINDASLNSDFAVTYCPLTGTGIAWDRNLTNGLTTFGVSGLLYNSNLIPYDRATDSYWSQIRRDCIHGEYIREKLTQIMVLDVPWETWKQLYPQGVVCSINTGYSRNYDRYPYGDYRESKETIFPVEHQDNRLHPKEYVHGIIINDKAKVYRFSSFQ